MNAFTTEEHDVEWRDGVDKNDSKGWYSRGGN